MYLRKAARHPYGRHRHTGNNGEEHRAEAVCHCPARIYRSRRRVKYPEEDTSNNDECGQRVQAGFPAPKNPKPHEHRGEKNRAGEHILRHNETEHDDEQPREDGDERIKFFIPQSHYFFITPDFLNSREMIYPIAAPRAHTATTATLMPMATPGFAPINALTAIPVSSVTV